MMLASLIDVTLLDLLLCRKTRCRAQTVFRLNPNSVPSVCQIDQRYIGRGLAA